MQNKEAISPSNKVYLCGTLVSDPEFTHDLYGEKFYEFKLAVPRLSDHKDIIPISVSEYLLDEKNIALGDKIALNGQFRSYNRMENDRSRLLLNVFAREFADASVPPPNPNYVELIGYVCKPPVFRTTPFSREICDVLLAVNRAYSKSDYIPCIAWGKNARILKETQVGKKLAVKGRIQSRTYVKHLDDGSTHERIAYELSINNLQLVKDEVASCTDEPIIKD